MAIEESVGTHNRILDVDLTTRTITEFQVTEADLRFYLGGKGLGLKILYERLRPGCDPLGEENVLIFMLGVMLGSGAPCSSRFAAVTKSPLTGLVASSSCGGPFGMALKTAGYDGLVIRGRADAPVILEIAVTGATIQPAGELWGLETPAVQAQLKLGKPDGALVIGPAGEHQVLYANIASGERFLGRGGFGAVMGSKRLKAVAVRGGAYKMIAHDAEGFQAVRKQALAFINANDFTSRVYRQQGTAANLGYCNRGGILPVRNFQGGSDPRAEALNGQAWKAAYQTQPHACKSCAILCGHQGTYPDGQKRKIPEYETLSLFGPNLEIFDSAVITEWSERCDALGLDTISAAVTIGYVMEAGEKGLLTTDLRFGTPDGITEMLEAIAYRQGFGDELADGVRRLSEKYGGTEFAIQVKGMELPGYDPRGAWGQGLAYAVSNRGGCHLSATLFAQEVFFGYLDPCVSKSKAKFVVFFNKLNAAVNALQTCVFTEFAYLMEPPLIKHTPLAMMRFFMQNFPEISISLLDIKIYPRFFETITGIKMSSRDFLRAGERINVLERYMNTREGVSRRDDTLPARFLNEGRSCDPQQRPVQLEPMLDYYYHLVGYDREGLPTAETLSRLGILAEPSENFRGQAIGDSSYRAGQSGEPSASPADFVSGKLEERKAGNQQPVPGLLASGFSGIKYRLTQATRLIFKR